MNVLRIYFSAQWQGSASPCPWALCDDSGLVLQQGLSPLADMPASRDCIGILAADRVLIFTTPQPPGSKRRWQGVLPFIAEEHTLTDPDDIHAVPSPSSEPGMITVSAIAKSWLKQLVAASTAAGLPLRLLVVETLLPVLQPDSWTLIWNESEGFLRTSPTTGLALDNGSQNTPPLALTLSLAASGIHTPRQIEVRFSGAASNFSGWDLAVPLVYGEHWDWQLAPINDTTPNLLWGDLSPPLRLFDGLAKLRPALFILLAALSIEVIGSHIEWAKLAHEKNTLTQQTAQIFRNTFGDDSELVDAPLQMQRNLAALRHTAGLADDTDFLPLLDTSSQALGSLKPGSIRGLNYETGKLELDLKLANAAEFQTIEHKLKQNGLRVRTSDIHDLGDGTQAKMTLSREGLR